MSGDVTPTGHQPPPGDAMTTDQPRTGDTITTADQLDALPIGSVVLDAFGASCTRKAERGSPFDWRRVTPAVKGGEHHHRPYLPATVLHDPHERSGEQPSPSVEDARAEAEKVLALAASGDLSDGHHTHRELYEYRLLYNAHAAHGWHAAGIPVVKSWRHSDGEECFGGGWFIVTATLPTGQVSNHYKAEHWDLFNVPEVDLPPEYDGHTPQDAADRLRDALAASRAVPSDQDALQRLARAAYAVDSQHHIRVVDGKPTCLCGFVGDARARTQTEHITAAVLEEYDHD